jgi:hypothetical protein
MESGNDDECNEILSSEDLIDPDLENEEEEARQEYEQKGNVIQRILRHVGLPTDAPEPRPVRPPPCPVDLIEDQSQDAREFDAAW